MKEHGSTLEPKGSIETASPPQAYPPPPDTDHPITSETPVYVDAEPHPVHVADRRSLLFAGVVAAVLSAGIALDLAVDLYVAGTVHVALEVAGVVLWGAAIYAAVRVLRSAHARSHDLAHTLARTRAEIARSQHRANRVLSGLAGVIEAQFVRWGLSPSERDVAMLLLKGLSLKEIAAARHASEATVRQQAQGVYRKAQVSGRAELSAHFLEDLLVPGEASPVAGRVNQGSE
jgi:DNA-binding CsgD family transcriptional regulator